MWALGVAGRPTLKSCLSLIEATTRVQFEDASNCNIVTRDRLTESRSSRLDAE